MENILDFHFMISSYSDCIPLIGFDRYKHILVWPSMR